MFFLSISKDILLFVAGFGILQAILLSCLMYFHPKTDRSVSKFLAYYISCWSIPMFMPFVLYFSTWQNTMFLEAFPFLLGPLLYLYVRSFKESITWRKAWPHFLLFFLFFVLDSVIYFSIGDRFNRSHLVPAEFILHPAVRVRIGIRIAQMVLYFFLARRTLATYRKSIHHLFSETSRINLTWVKWLINGYLFLVLAIIAVYFLVARYPEQFDLIILVNVTIVTPYIYWITYKGISQPTLWQIQRGMKKESLEEQMQQAEKMEINVIEEKKPKALKSGLGESRMDDLVKKIIVLMEQEKLYQETELTLSQLASKLQVPAYQVSQCINEGMKKTFYDLVNEYRVEQAKNLLVDSNKRNFTILSVAFEAGFNSKTTFNTVFKKYTGLTPTEYRNRQNQGEIIMQ